MGIRPLGTHIHISHICVSTWQGKSVCLARLCQGKQPIHRTQLEKDGIVSIERFEEGWCLMPSKNHINVYRAMTEAIKKSQRED